MSQVLIEFINDVIDETSDNYNLILGKTKEEVKSVEESYKYIFAVISIFTALIIALTSSATINLSAGITILAINLVSAVLILLARQRRLRKLHDAYGEYISVLGQKKNHFLKIRKEIHYWEYITTSFSPKVIRDTLIALESIDAAYAIYNIEIYEKLLPILTLDTKRVVFRSLLVHIRLSVELVKDLQRVGSKPLPFFVQKEIKLIHEDNKKYISDNYMEPLVESTYEKYIDFTDYINFVYGGVLTFIRKYGLKVFLLYSKALKPYEFLIDENFNTIKYRLKNDKNRLAQFDQTKIHPLKFNKVSTN